MLTYPRTDSRYLPEDYISKVHETMRDLANSDHPISNWAAIAIEEDRVKFNKRIFNNAKVSITLPSSRLAV